MVPRREDARGLDLPWGLATFFCLDLDLSLSLDGGLRRFLGAAEDLRAAVCLRLVFFFGMRDPFEWAGGKSNTEQAWLPRGGKHVAGFYNASAEALVLRSETSRGVRQP